MLPKQNKIDHNINRLISLKLDPLTEKLDKQFMSYDERIIKIRKEFDMNRLERLIKSKVDIIEMNQHKESQDFKIAAIEANFNLIVKDLQSF